MFAFVLNVVVLVAFCGASYLGVVNSRDDRIPTKADFLAALLPLVCIPAVLSLCTGLHKWWDDLCVTFSLKPLDEFLSVAV